LDASLPRGRAREHYFDNVQVPEDNILGHDAQSLLLIITTTLSYLRLSVAWGVSGYCEPALPQAASHARTRRQFGKPLEQHQLIKRYLAELFVLEQSAAQLCEHASRSWDAGTPDTAIKAVLAKQVSARNAAQGSAMAVQVLASAGARGSDLVARAYRDSKLMEIIEGSTEICQLLLADHAMSLY
jgi:methoxymalonate biosynthesis protein